MSKIGSLGEMTKIEAKRVDFNTISSDVLCEKNQTTAMDKSTNVVVDIESLAQPSDSPKMTKALSRKGPSRIERRNGEELEVEEPSRKLAVKDSQMEQLKQTLISSKPLVSVIIMPTNASSPTDATDARNKRFNRFAAIHPKKILFIITTLSCIGTLILIYCTLTISTRGGA